MLSKNRNAAAPAATENAAMQANSQDIAMKTAVRNKPEIKYLLGRCSLGVILVASSDKGVCAILLGDESAPLLESLRERFPAAQLIEAPGSLARTVEKVAELVESPGIRLDVALDARGTDFQQRVWRALREIPVGATATYTDIASRIGSPKSVRAVAQACAANPIAVAIPCHRVVRSDGALSGYRWGVERKRTLLAREGAR
jgi:AraC family transcriptional regulator, regulatory protein of adaptative response / methylated-DNA-[protein]-cysteine methyltransferase